MTFTLTNDFQKINVTSGTIQNVDPAYTVELSDSADSDSGIFLFPHNKYSFSGTTLYARCFEQGRRAEVRVVPFAVDLGSGGSSGATVDDSLVASDDEIDNLLEDVFGSDTGSSVDDSQIASDDEINDLLDDIFGH